MRIRNFNIWGQDWVLLVKGTLSGFMGWGFITSQIASSLWLQRLAIPIAIMLSLLPAAFPYQFLSSWFVLLFVPLFFLLTLSSVQRYKGKVGSKVFIPHRIVFIGFILPIFSGLLPFLLYPNFKYSEKTKLSDGQTLFYHHSLAEAEVNTIAVFLQNLNDSVLKSLERINLNRAGAGYVLELVSSSVNSRTDLFLLNDILYLELKLNYQDVLKYPIHVVLANPVSGKKRFLSREFLPSDSLERELAALILHPLPAGQRLLVNVAVTKHELSIVKQALGRLKNYFPPQRKFDIIFTKFGNSYSLVFFVDTMHWRNTTQLERLRQVGEYIERSGIYREISVELVDKKGFRKKIN